MPYYNYFSKDSKVSFGEKTLEYYNSLCSPSEVKKELELSISEATIALDNMEVVYFKTQYEDDWFLYHFHDGKQTYLRKSVLYRKRINQETGESADVSLLNLADFKKEINIKYQFTKSDGEKVLAHTTISKKSLTSLLETLLLISKSTEPFSLYISKRSLKK